MYDIDYEPSYSRPCKLRMPGQEPQPFTAVFRVLPESRREEIAAQKGEAGLLAAVVLRLEDVQTTEGQPIDTPELVARVLDLLPWARALSAGYVEAVYGIPSAASLGN